MTKKLSFAKVNKLSAKQLAITEAIQKAVYENDTDYLVHIPIEVWHKAIEAQTAFDKQNFSAESIALDNELAQLVKKYWGKKGIAISQ